MNTKNPISMSRWSNFARLMVVAAACLLPLAAWADEKKPANPREMFRTLGVGDTYFERLTGGVALDADETDALLRILYKLRQFPAWDLERWAADAGKLDNAIKLPGKFRGSIFRLRGRVLAVEPQRSSSDQSQRYEMPRYFRCRLKLDSSPRLADVYTENVPAAWQQGAKLDAVGGALGVFLKVGQKTNGHDTLVFVAPRLAWYLDDPLGQLGMDFGLLDDLHHAKDLTPQRRAALDCEAFYQMLAAVGRAKPRQLLRQADAELKNVPKAWRSTNEQGQPRYSVVPLYNAPETQIGRLVALSGTARLIEEVRVENPDTIARFGFDHYYQVSLFTDDSQGNPLTFCLRELPEGMPYGNEPHYGENVRVAGFFFKTWSYRVPKMTDPTLTPDPKTNRQLSPLLIGRSLVWHPAAKPADNTFWNVAVIASLLAVMLVVWAVAWRSRRRERRWVERAIGEKPTLDAGVDLSQAEKSAKGGPDFGRVAEMDRGSEHQENS